MDDSKFDFSLILACYNEGVSFIKNVKKVFEVLDQTDFFYEIIFVEDCSKDKTKEKIKKILKNNSHRHLSCIFHQKNEGRGKSVAEGILEAKGKVVGFIDIDLEIPAEYIPRFVNEIFKGADVVVARRIYDFTLPSLPRWFASKGYICLRKLFFKTDFLDSEAGYKFFNRKKILPVLKKTKDPGWFWDTEIMLQSQKAGLKIKEIPTVFIKNIKKKSTVRLIPDSLNYFKKLISFRKKFKL